MTTLNGMAFTFGGWYGWDGWHCANNTYMFEFNINQKWVSRSSMPISIASCAVVAINDSTALLCGGVKYDYAISNRCFFYSSVKDSWTESTWPLKIARRSHAMTVYNGSVYAYGGEVGGGAFVDATEKLSEDQGWEIHLPGTRYKIDLDFASIAIPTEFECADEQKMCPAAHFFCEHSVPFQGRRFQDVCKFTCKTCLRYTYNNQSITAATHENPPKSQGNDANNWPTSGILITGSRGAQQ
jgi:hypothetical protein